MGGGASVGRHETVRTRPDGAVSFQRLMKGGRRGGFS